VAFILIKKCGKIIKYKNKRGKYKRGDKI